MNEEKRVGTELEDVAALASAVAETGFFLAADTLHRLYHERERYMREAASRARFTALLAAACRKTNLRLRRFQAAYLRCRRQYEVLNRLHRAAMQRIELLSSSTQRPGDS